MSRPKKDYPERECEVCHETFKPRSVNQTCCKTVCRNQKQHNARLEPWLKDDWLKIVHAGQSERDPQSWYFTIMLRGFRIKGFFFNQSTRRIRWPKIFLSYGPFYQQPGHGLSIPSKRLQTLMEKWIDEHDDYQKVSLEPVEEEEIKPRSRFYAISPCCNVRCISEDERP